MIFAIETTSNLLLMLFLLFRGAFSLTLILKTFLLKVKTLLKLILFSAGNGLLYGTSTGELNAVIPDFENLPKPESPERSDSPNLPPPNFHRPRRQELPVLRRRDRSEALSNFYARVLSRQGSRRERTSPDGQPNSNLEERAQNHMHRLINRHQFLPSPVVSNRRLVISINFDLHSNILVRFGQHVIMFQETFHTKFQCLLIAKLPLVQV